MKEKREKISHLPVRHTVLPNGLKISYIEHGTGPHLVLIPGLFQNMNATRHLIIKLARFFTVICLAMPGADGSDPLPDYSIESVNQWFKQSLQVLGIKRAFFVSISMGASIVTVLLSQLSDLASGYLAYEPVVKVADARIGWRQLYRLVKYLRWFRLGPIAAGIIWLFRAFLIYGLRLGFAKSMRATSVRSLIRVGDLISDYTLFCLIQRVGGLVPTRCVVGSHGMQWLLNRDSIAGTSQILDSSGVEILNGAGHMLGRENQIKLAGSVVEFARSQKIIDS